MKKLLLVIPLVILFCFTFGCQKGEEVAEKKAASVINDAFELEEDDNLEIIEFSLESQDTALVNLRLNGNKLSSKIKKAEAGWKLSVIQNKQEEWIPADYYLMIKGRLIHETDEVIVNRAVILYEVAEEGGELQLQSKMILRSGSGGMLMNPSTETDSRGNFTIIADRRFWEESGIFTLGISLWSGMSYLRGPDNKYVTFEVDKNAKRIELGEIKVNY
jgi:hypothetical protein